MNRRLLILTVFILFLIKITAIWFTNFNLFGDEAQYWLWSKNLDFGYFSKPPLLSWFIAAYSFIFGENFFSLKLLPSIIYFLTAWAVYELCRNLNLKKNTAVSCALLFLFIPAVSFSSFILSTDIFLILFWTLSLNELIKVKKNTRLKSFFFLGIFLGCSFLSKYAAVYFFVSFFCYILLDKNFRNFFLKNYLGFSLSFFCCFLILLPNIIWNFNNGWVTLQHTSDNANLVNMKIDIFRGFEFLIIQILMLGPVLFLATIFNYKKLTFSENQKFLLIFSLPIFLIVFIEAVFVRANANWAAPALVSFFLFLYISIENDNVIFKRINLLFNFCFCVIFFFLIGTNYQAPLFKRIIGLNEFSNIVYSQGLKKNIVDYVVSDRLLFSSMKYELRNKEIIIHMPYKKGSKITNHFMISSPLKKEINRNFILIGPLSDIDYLDNSFTTRRVESPIHNFTDKEIFVYEVVFN